MLLTQAGTCLLLRDVVVMYFIPPPNGSSYFEVSAIFGMVILMTFVAMLRIYGIASRNFILVSLCIFGPKGAIQVRYYYYYYYYYY